MFDFLKKLFPKKKKKPKKKVVKAKKKSSKTSSTKSKNAVCYSRTNSVRLKPSDDDDTSTSTQSNETEVKTNNTSKNGRQRSKYGFAATKEEPHKKHPAFYRKNSSNDIDYITFTHSTDVDDENGNQTIKTIPLTSNINPKERGKRISYMYPKSYKGKRSALGKEETKYSLTKEDKKIVLDALDTLPKEQIKKTSNSKKKSK